MTRENEQQAKALRSNVFRQMLETRAWKYRIFLRHLHLFRYLAFAPTRGEFLESYYALMRYFDDIVDGDIPLPKTYTNVIEYLIEKIEFSKNPDEPKDDADCLMMYCFELAKKFGENFHSETKDILESLLFDARRRGKGVIFQKEELAHHFHLLDIRGTVKATLKIFKDDPDKYKILESLGTASRHQFDIEDFESDISAGYINISLEDCENFGIKKEDLCNKSSSKIKSWLRHHADHGIELLKEHHRKMPEGEFSFLEKVVFKFVYEIPAKKVFRKILSET